MTRETKIGLLVGLAFLLVVGILLSDHVSSAARPPEASLESAAGDVAAALSAPDHDDVAPIFELRQPETLVAAADEPAEEPSDEHYTMAPIYDADAAPLALHESPSDDAWDAVVPDSDAVEVEADETIDEAAAATDAGLATQSVSVQDYTVKAGDSLSKLAVTFLGADTPEHREIIIALNPSLRKNPDKLLLGVTYLVPAGGVKPAPAEQPTASTPTATPSANTYEVQPGDSLWRIADQVCGDPSLVDDLKQLNADVLNGKDIVRVGMKLRLPE